MTTTLTSDGRVCRSCNRVHGVDGYNPRHPATYMDDDPRGPQEPSEPAVVAFPFDPVLRAALMAKGVITPDDLTQAEAMVRATTGQLWREVVQGGTANG